MLVSLLPASGLRLHIGRSINTDRRAGSNRPPERAQCKWPVGTGPTWTGFRKREHPRSLKKPQRPETLGVLKSPGSNESQGGGGLKLLPGAIGPDLVVSHSRVLQLQGTYEDSENGSICFRSAAKRPSIPQPGKNTRDLLLEAPNTSQQADPAGKESGEFTERCFKHRHFRDVQPRSVWQTYTHCSLMVGLFQVYAPPSPAEIRRK